MKLSMIACFALVGCGGAIGPNLPEDAGPDVNTVITVNGGGCITQTENLPGCETVTLDHGNGNLQTAYFCCYVDAGDGLTFIMSNTPLPIKTVGLPTKPSVPIESSPDE